MIKALIARIGKTENSMHRVVEKTTDTRAAHPMRFGFQIQTLADQAAFPKQMPVSPSASVQRGLEFGEHPKTECAITGDRLMTRQMTRGVLAIRRDEFEQGQVCGGLNGPPFAEFGLLERRQQIVRFTVSAQHIQACRHALDPMHEQC